MSTRNKPFILHNGKETILQTNLSSQESTLDWQKIGDDSFPFLSIREVLETMWWCAIN